MSNSSEERLQQQALKLLFRHVLYEEFFGACFRGLWAISSESWHLEQRTNPDGAFRIFCHANYFKNCNLFILAKSRVDIATKTTNFQIKFPSFFLFFR